MKIFTLKGDTLLDFNPDYAQKSIEIRKSLISSVPREFEWSPEHLVTRILPPTFKFNIWKDLDHKLLKTINFWLVSVYFAIKLEK